MISTKIIALALTGSEIFAKNHFQKIDVFRKLFIFFNFFRAYYWRFLKQFSSNFWTFSNFFKFFSLNFTKFFIFSVPIIEYFWKFLVQIFENFVTFSKNLQFFPEILWNFLFFFVPVIEDLKKFWFKKYCNSFLKISDYPEKIGKCFKEFFQTLPF